MTNPQLENGYTSIAHEILENLMRVRLSGNQFQVVLCIIRKTYGFHKKADFISNQQICEMTGLGKTVVSRVLARLLEMNIISRKGKYIGFMKDYSKWHGLAEKLTFSAELAEQSTSGSELSSELTGEDAEGFQKLADQSSELAKQSKKVSNSEVTQKIKDNSTKDNNNDETKKKYGEFNNVLLTDVEYAKLIERFRERGTTERIEKLSAYMASRKKRYQSHYATILTWERNDNGSKKSDAKPSRNHTANSYESPTEFIERRNRSRKD